MEPNFKGKHSRSCLMASPVARGIRRPSVHDMKPGEWLTRCRLNDFGPRGPGSFACFGDTMASPFLPICIPSSLVERLEISAPAAENSSTDSESIESAAEECAAAKSDAAWAEVAQIEEAQMEAAQFSAAQFAEEQRKAA